MANFATRDPAVVQAEATQRQAEAAAGNLENAERIERLSQHHMTSREITPSKN
jgi:hypothetical protein